MERSLNEFKELTKKIDADRAAYENKYKPIVESFSEQVPREKMKSEFTSYLPFILQREGTIARWLLTNPLASKMEPKFDQLTAQAFQNPKLMAQILQARPQISKYVPAIDEVTPAISGILGGSMSIRKRQR